MEHDQRACPRCGEPAGDSRFCQYCRAQLDSLTGIPAPAGAHEADPSYLAAQVLRLEQALAAASQGINDRIAGETSTAVQVEAEPRQADNGTDEASMVSLERAQLSTGVDQRPGSGLQPPREVARLEQVLTVAPVDRRDQIAPVSDDALVSADTTAQVSAAPVDMLELPASAEEPECPATEPIYVTAQALREAFWFEQASAFKSLRQERAVSRHAPQVGPAETQAGHNTTSVAPPAQPAASVPPDADPSPSVGHDDAVAERCPDQTSENHWVAALCVLALIALLALLTGRRPRR